jgi:hypothetical protein
MQMTATARYVTAHLLQLQRPPSFPPRAKRKRESERGEPKSRDTYGAAEQEQHKAPRLFVPRPFLCAPPTTTTTTPVSSQQARSASPRPHATRHGTERRGAKLEGEWAWHGDLSRSPLQKRDAHCGTPKDPRERGTARIREARGVVDWSVGAGAERRPGPGTGDKR